MKLAGPTRRQRCSSPPSLFRIVRENLQRHFLNVRTAIEEPSSLSNSHSLCSHVLSSWPPASLARRSSLSLERPSSDPCGPRFADFRPTRYGLDSLSDGAPSVAYTVMGMLCLDALELSHAASRADGRSSASASACELSTARIPMVRLRHAIGSSVDLASNDGSMAGV